tara:strand:+ start:1502 stop:2005 length:504 start_codon:yes stop_codon:yes gene_type:complete
MNFITPRIAVGGAQDAKDFKERGITAVLNVCKGLNLELPDWLEYRSVGLQTHKHGIDKIYKELVIIKYAVDVLEELLEEHDKVMVHCMSGNSRSPGVVIFYLHFLKSMNFEAVVEMVERKNNGPRLKPAFFELAAKMLDEKFSPFADNQMAGIPEQANKENCEVRYL